MRIWEYVGSTAEAVKRHAPDATPLKEACINSCTAALTKIAVPVKSACRNSYDCGSAAFAKVDSTVRAVRLRRRTAGGETGGAYERIPAEEVEEQEGLIPTPVKTNACSDGGAVKSVSYSYGFLTFAKIGYIVRDKVVCRIVQRISDDGTKSSVSIYATDFAHESNDDGKLILAEDSPVKNVFDKVKSACSGGSVAFAEIGHAVTAIRLRRRMAADETYEKISEERVKTNPSSDFAKIGETVVASVESVCRNSCSYTFIAFAKFGYTVRVKGVCRFVEWISDDGTKSIIGVYASNSANDSQESKQLITGQGVAMPAKSECRNFYTIDFITFARIGYVVRVRGIYRIGQWMTDPDTKAQVIMFATILARNARKHGHQHRHRFLSGRAVIFIILCNTLIDVVNENIELWKEKADSSKQKSSGSQELVPGAKYVSKDGNDFYSAAFESLKDKVTMDEVLEFMVREFGAFWGQEPFRTQFFSSGILTMESLVFMMREFFEFMMKQFFGDQFFSGIDEILVAVLRDIFGIKFFDEWGFHGSSTKGRKKNGKHKCY